MALGVASQSLIVPVGLQAEGLEINVRDAFTQYASLTVHDLNIRVFGDDQGITISTPIVASRSAQLVAPDGQIVLPAGTQFTASNVVIKTSDLTVPDELLTISADSLTLITPAAAAENLTIRNDRSLVLSATSDDSHMVQLDATLADVFFGITWVASISSAWASQLFDGALNPWAIAVGGLLDVQLQASPASSDHELTVRGGLRSW
ncbi:MAG: hypothetical protein ACKON9_24010, partial [Planctomycetaceae bacterium]